MIAIFDESDKSVYFISDSIRKLSFSDAANLLANFPNQNIACVFAKQTSSEEIISYLSGYSINNSGDKYQAASAVVAGMGKYVVPIKASAVIVAGLNPPLMFENGYDYKSLDSIKSAYGGSIPHQIDKLISNGRLRIVGDSEISNLEARKRESLKIAQRKHKNGGKKVDSYDDGDSDGGDGDDRIIRKAARINL
jgi:hypothetical protein